MNQTDSEQMSKLIEELMTKKKESATMVTWKELILNRMEHNKDSYENIEHTDTGDFTNSLVDTDENFDGNWDEFEFDNSYGVEGGRPFIMYTKDYIYFPVCYDGSEWVGSLPRNPDKDFEPRHFGGG